VLNVLATAAPAAPAAALAAGVPPAPASTPAGMLPRAEFVSFFTALRPGVDAAIAGRLFDAMDGYAGAARSGALSRMRFRQLLFCFGRVVARRARGSPPAPLRAAATPQPAAHASRAARVAAASAAAGAASDAASAGGADEGVNGADGGDPASSSAPDWDGRHDSAASTLTMALGLDDDEDADDAAFFTGDADVEVFDGGGGARLRSPRAAAASGNPLAAGAASASASAAASPPPPSPSLASGLGVRIAAYFDDDVEGLEARRASALRSGVPRDIPRSSVRGRALAALDSLAARVLFELLGVLGIVVVLAQLALAARAPGPTVALLSVLNYVSFAILTAKLAAFCALLGPLRFARASFWNRFELAVCALGAAAVAADALAAGAPGAANLLTAAMFLRLAKVLRSLRLVPGLAVTFLAFFDMLPALARYLAMLAAVLYAFALAGIVAFAGALDAAADPAVAASAYGQLGFGGLTFDNLAAALLTLLALLNVVDWPVIMEGVVAARGNAARLYFVAFWLLAVAVALNVTVAFVVEGFSIHKARRERLARLEDAALRAAAAADADAHAADAAHAGTRRRASSVGAWARGGARMPSALAAAAAASGAAAKDHGLADWRGVLARSAVRFDGWRLARPPHHMDIYETLYFEQIAAAFADTLDDLAPARTPASAAAAQDALETQTPPAWLAPPARRPPGLL
jgi:hypothetical protein